MNDLGGPNGGLVPMSQLNDTISESIYSRGVGEWADGDALAAHYGYGFDYFCTNDQAGGAGPSSIFHATNLLQLNERFSINVVTPDTLIQIIDPK